MAVVTQVAAPKRRPRSGGIKAIVGDFTREQRLAATEGIAWEDGTCGFPAETLLECFVEDDAVAKTGDSVEIQDGIGAPFALYAGVSCYIGGDADGDSYAAQARRVLEAGEDRTIEAKLWEWIGDTLSTATATSLTEAIAKAEDFADANYTGLPVLVLSRSVATLAFAEGALAEGGPYPTTVNGTPVLASGEAGPEVAVGIIGWPEVYASDVLSHQNPDLAFNMDLAIAERVYAVGVDCEFRHLVTITEEP